MSGSKHEIAYLRSLLARVLVVLEDVNQALDDAISFSEAFGDNEDNAERFDSWREAGESEDAKLTLREAMKSAGGKAVLVLERKRAAAWNAPAERITVTDGWVVKAVAEFTDPETHGEFTQDKARQVLSRAGI